ncbi:hypothetical protein ACTHTD_11965, partial [Neisseria sp. P0017.S005]|uniref:hypothetical protein n=1 Tax=Neisseria sp. P0017.S005 TaxID=3436781 RepID=UPI003F7FFC36
TTSGSLPRPPFTKTQKPGPNSHASCTPTINKPNRTSPSEKANCCTDGHINQSATWQSTLTSV